MNFFPCCCLALGLIVLSPPPLPAAVSQVVTVQQIPYPEDEILRRREAINSRIKESEHEARGIASQLIPIPHALPLTGTLEITSGSTSTFYGKLRRDIRYTIKERFVGNLVVTRFYDPKAHKYTGREEYSLDTISMEIDGSDFKGKVCSKYAGSPPTCIQWQDLDLWQAASGEEFPGRKSNVVTASSSGQTVSLRIDGPDIFFISSQNGQKLKSGCGDQVQSRLTRDEFKRMLNRKSIKVKKVLGKTFPGCSPGSTVTLEMEIGK